MSATARYLEAEKIDALATQLKAQGYTVTIPASAGPGEDYDLVASKGDHRIAFDVKSLSSLAQSRQLVRDHRRRAFQEGFTDFRLMVVSPPHQTHVSIPGLDNELAAYMRDNVPAALQTLATNIRIEAVTSLVIDSIVLTDGGTDIAGSGVVEVTMEHGHGHDGEESPDDFPFRFHALLDQNRHILHVNELAVNVSSLIDE